MTMLADDVVVSVWIFDYCLPIGSVVVDDDDEWLELIFGFVLPVLVFLGCLVAVDLFVDKWMLFDLWIPDVIRLQFDYCSRVDSEGIPKQKKRKWQR